jgi:hypothetical protein
VIFAAGDVRIVNAAGQERRAVKGAQIQEGETVVSAPGASAQLQMKDGAYVALRPDSRLRVDTYVYNGREDGSESGLLSLLKGGFRTITGFIGRTNKDRYQVRTPTATIGIRGTDHEPYYIAPPAPGETPAGVPGTYTKVNVGIAYIQTPAGSVDVFPNQVGFAAPDQLPQVLPQIPDFFRSSAAPASDPQRARVEAPAAAAAERGRVASDAVSTSGVTAQTAPLSAVHAPVPPEPKVPILAQGASPINLGNPTDPTYPGTEPAPTTPPPEPPPPTTAIVAATSYPTLITDDFATLEAGVTRDTATGAPIGFNESYAGFTFGLRLISPNAVAPAFSTSPTAQIDCERRRQRSYQRQFHRGGDERRSRELRPQRDAG